MNWAKLVADHVNKKYKSNYTEEQIRDDKLAWYCFDIGLAEGAKSAELCSQALSGNDMTKICAALGYPTDTDVDSLVNYILYLKQDSRSTS